MIVWCRVHFLCCSKMLLSNLFKKATLDQNILNFKNYRPASNLAFLSKVIEKYSCNTFQIPQLSRFALSLTVSLSCMPQHGDCTIGNHKWRLHYWKSPVTLMAQSPKTSRGGASLVLKVRPTSTDTLQPMSCRRAGLRGGLQPRPYFNGGQYFKK